MPLSQRIPNLPTSMGNARVRRRGNAKEQAPINNPPIRNPRKPWVWPRESPLLCADRRPKLLPARCKYVQPVQRVENPCASLNSAPLPLAEQCEAPLASVSPMPRRVGS
eukprot:15175919-Alexandrium_andersonii.AAC.1